MCIRVELRLNQPNRSSEVWNGNEKKKRLTHLHTCAKGGREKDDLFLYLERWMIHPVSIWFYLYPIYIEYQNKFTGLRFHLQKTWLVVLGSHIESNRRNQINRRKKNADTYLSWIEMRASGFDIFSLFVTMGV